MKKTCVIMGIVAWLMLSCVACGEKRTEEQLQSSVETIQQENTVVSQAVSDTLATNKPGVEKVENQSNCLVQVQTVTQLGSGILWDKREEIWTFVTAAHVVEDAEQAKVYFVPEDRMYPAQVHMVKGLDLAFLQVASAVLEEDILDAYAACSASETEVQSGAVLSAIGYSASGERKVYNATVEEPWIYIEDFENYMLLCEGEAEAGMSGGGIFTKAGDVAGMICGANENGQLAVLPTLVIEGELSLFIDS